MRATLRWAHSDLRAHRGEALFLVLATAGIVASLLLATALFGYATNPWQRVFTQSHGAHVWLHTDAVADPGGQVIGLRLTDPGDTSYVVQRAVTVLGAGAIGEVSTWQKARAEAQGDNRLLGQVLGLFGLGALVAAGLAVHGALATRIRGHLRDISVLKA